MPEVMNGHLDEKQLLSALRAYQKGDFSARLPIEWTGTGGKIADTFNAILERNEKVVRELERVSRVVGKEGKITQRATIGEADGAWLAMGDSINALVEDLARPTAEMARVPAHRPDREHHGGPARLVRRRK
jgi:hypothetical protein